MDKLLQAIVYSSDEYFHNHISDFAEISSNFSVASFLSNNHLYLFYYLISSSYLTFHYLEVHSNDVHLEWASTIHMPPWNLKERVLVLQFSEKASIKITIMAIIMRTLSNLVSWFVDSSFYSLSFSFEISDFLNFWAFCF